MGEHEAVSQEDVENLRRGYAAYSRGDLPGALELIDPRFEIHTSGAFLDEGRVYRGHDGVREFLAMLSEAFEDVSYEPEEILEAEDDRYLVLARLRGRGKASGAETDVRFAHLWTIRDRKAIRMRAYLDRDEALRAAGLEADR